MALSAGDKLGAYEIVSLLGKGGMGEVWKAHDPQLRRDVAIKISAQQFTDRFKREARAIAALNHTNICTLYDVGPHYLVMELIEGPTLADRIQQGPMVHRDLKPANVKIRSDGVGESTGPSACRAKRWHCFHCPGPGSQHGNPG